jgi:hypothetical protein
MNTEQPKLDFMDATVIAPDAPPPAGEIWLVVAYRKTGQSTGYWGLLRKNRFEEFSTQAEAEAHLKKADSVWKHARIVRIVLP